MHNRNPFDLIDGHIDNIPVKLRPVRFDSDDYNRDFIKPDGNIIRPEMANTTCPKCFQLVETEIGPDENLNSVIDVFCENCFPKKESLEPEFSFENPLETGRLPYFLVKENFIADKKPEIVIDNEMTEERLMGLGNLIKRNRPKKKNDQIEEYMDELADLSGISGE